MTTNKDLTQGRSRRPASVIFSHDYSGSHFSRTAYTGNQSARLHADPGLLLTITRGQSALIAAAQLPDRRCMWTWSIVIWLLHLLSVSLS